MNATKSFYSHETENRIMIKKDKVEVENWTEDLEYIDEELNYLLKIEDRMLESSELYRQLHTLRRDNQLTLGMLYRYENSMRNAIECDTMECDAYYFHNHEKSRNTYRQHIQKYRGLKSKVLSKILQNSKR